MVQMSPEFFGPNFHDWSDLVNMDASQRLTKISGLLLVSGLGGWFVLCFIRLRSTSIHRVKWVISVTWLASLSSSTSIQHLKVDIWHLCFFLQAAATASLALLTTVEASFWACTVQISSGYITSCHSSIGWAPVILIFPYVPRSKLLILAMVRPHYWVDDQPQHISLLPMAERVHLLCRAQCSRCLARSASLENDEPS